jgi:DNA invertase Pin-like site-specific DNA recombinase
MHAAVYLRQSLDRTGEGLAVARQRRDCLALCKQRRWTPVEYVDNDRSATNGKPRPAYQRMLTDIADGKIGAVVVWDLDRLHRQPRELEDFIDLADARALKLATVTGDCDLSTDNGRLHARIKGVVGKAETERKSTRQRSAAKQKAEAGKPQWRNAFGYLDTADGPVPDPHIAPLVVQAYATILAGGSYADICRLFNDAGALTKQWIKPKDANGDTIKTAKAELVRHPWTQPQVSNFLRKPRNAGLREHNGVIVGKGNWLPLVASDTWEAVQRKLNEPGRAPGSKSVRQHLLTSLLGCGKPGCGGKLSGRWAMQQTGEHAIVYQCRTCHGVRIRAEQVEPLIYRLVGERLAMPDAVDLLRAEQHDTAEAERLRTETATLLARLDEIADERADGLIDGKGYQKMTERITDKLEAIEARQQSAELVRVFDGIPLGKSAAVAAIKKLSPDRFRSVLSVLVTITVAPCGKGRGRVFDPERVVVDWN